MAWFFPTRGRTAMRRVLRSKVSSPARSCEKAAAMAKVATARAMTRAIGSPRTPHRVDRETSAAITIGALLSWSNSRVEFRLEALQIYRIGFIRAIGYARRMAANSSVDQAHAMGRLRSFITCEISRLVVWA